MEFQALNHESVLSYWFGTVPTAAELERKRKELWFISEQNAALRDEKDEEITAKFGNLLLLAKEGKLDDAWACENCSARQILALVVLLDQMSRHVYRKERELVDECTLRAFRHAKAALDRGLHTQLPTSQFCFLIMPLRHFLQMDQSPNTDNFEEKRKVMTLLESKIVEQQQLLQSESTILERFQTATDRRRLLPGSEDRSVLTKLSDEEILDASCLSYPVNGNYIGVHHNSALENEPVYQSILRFLLQRLPERGEVHLFVSLSGGVDSMVIAKILSEMARNDYCFDLSTVKRVDRNELLRKKNKKRRKMEEQDPKNTHANGQAKRVDQADDEKKRKISVHAVHIDYGNREESYAEARFVEKWCEGHGIEFVERRITEIKRGVTPRDEYEKMTRAMRFQTYKEVIGESGMGIIFGHHKGDVQENVISNVMKGCSVMEISGMTAESLIDGVKVWRPLLQHDKREIYRIASEYFVPFFKDSTPKWSTRGKLRDNLIPAIASTYGEGFRHNLTTLAIQSDELNDYLRSTMFRDFWQDTCYGKLAVVMPLTDYLDHPRFFWKVALRHVCHTLGQGAVKDRACIILTDLLNNRRLGSKVGSKCQWVVLKQTQPSCIYLESPQRLILFHQNTLFAPSEDMFADKVVLGTEHQFGKYTVKVSKCIDGIDNRGCTFDLFSWLQDGFLSYKLPETESYTLCRNHGKELPFFHNVDRTIRMGIPIMINSGDVRTKSSGQVCVTVNFHS